MLEQLPCVGTEIRLFGRRNTGHQVDILVCLLLDDVHCVVEGNNTDHARIGVHDGKRDEIVFGEHFCNGFLIGQRADGNHIFIHDFRDRRAVVFGQQQVLDGNRTQQPARLRDIAGIDGLLIHTGSANACDRLRDGHTRPQRHIFRVHDRACGIFGILQDPVDFLAHFRMRLRQNALDDVGGHFLDQICGVIDIQLVDNLAQLGIGKAADQKLL